MRGLWIRSTTTRLTSRQPQLLGVRSLCTPLPAQATLTHNLHKCKDSGDFNKAKRLLRQYQLATGWVRLLDCSIVVAAFVQGDRVDLALEWIENLYKNYSIRPRAILYNSAITQCQGSQATIDILSHMLNCTKIEPDVITLNTTLKTFQRARSLVPHCHQFFDMLTEKYDVEPNTLSYALYLQALYVAKDTSATHEALRRVITSNIGINGRLFKQMLLAATLIGDSPLITKLVSERHKYPTISKAYIAGILTSYYLKTGEVIDTGDSEDNFLKVSRPTIKMCNAHLNRMINENALDAVQNLLKKMKENDVNPDIATFGLVLKLLTKNDDVEEAIETFNELKLRWKPNSVVFAQMIDMMYRIGRFDDVCSLWKEMLELKVLPKGSTTSKVLRSCVIRGDWISACWFIENYDKTNTASKFETIYGSVISVCIAKGEYDIAQILSHRMTLLGSQCNSETQHLIDTGLKHISECKTLWSPIGLRKILRLKANHFETLFESYNHWNHLKRALIIFEELHQCDLIPTLPIYWCMIRLFLKNHRFLEACLYFAEISVWMKAKCSVGILRKILGNDILLLECLENKKILNMNECAHLLTLMAAFREWNGIVSLVFLCRQVNLQISHSLLLDIADLMISNDKSYEAIAILRLGGLHTIDDNSYVEQTMHQMKCTAEIALRDVKDRMKEFPTQHSVSIPNLQNNRLLKHAYDAYDKDIVIEEFLKNRSSSTKMQTA